MKESRVFSKARFKGDDIEDMNKKRGRKNHRLNSGETIAETLFAMLIIALTFLALAGSIMTASRVNASVQNEQTVFVNEAKGANTDGTVNIKVNTGTIQEKNVQIDITTLNNDYCYFTRK